MIRGLVGQPTRTDRSVGVATTWISAANANSTSDSSINPQPGVATSRLAPPRKAVSLRSDSQCVVPESEHRVGVVRLGQVDVVDDSAIADLDHSVA